MLPARDLARRGAKAGPVLGDRASSPMASPGSRIRQRPCQTFLRLHRPRMLPSTLLTSGSDLNGCPALPPPSSSSLPHACPTIKHLVQCFSGSQKDTESAASPPPPPPPSPSLTRQSPRPPAWPLRSHLPSKLTLPPTPRLPAHPS